MYIFLELGKMRPHMSPNAPELPKSGGAWAFSQAPPELPQVVPSTTGNDGGMNSARALIGQVERARAVVISDSSLQAPVEFEAQSYKLLARCKL